MNNIEAMQQCYLLAQEHCGLKVGDWVKVVRKAEYYKCRWNNFWLKIKSEMIGKVYQIIDMDKYGIWLNINNKKEKMYSFPYFVLKKVEKPIYLNKELTKEQWQVIAEKLAEYLSRTCAGYEYKENCAEICPLPCDPLMGYELYDFEDKDVWVEKAKKELGYE